MDEPEPNFCRTFNITQKHIDFLNKINDNNSLALRIVLDSIIKNNHHTRFMKEINNILYFSSIGIILLFISYLIPDFVIKLICISIGSFIVIYNLIGGVFSAISLQKYK